MAPNVRLTVSYILGGRDSNRHLQIYDNLDTIYECLNILIQFEIYIGKNNDYFAFILYPKLRYTHRQMEKDHYIEIWMDNGKSTHFFFHQSTL